MEVGKIPVLHRVCFQVKIKRDVRRKEIRHFEHIFEEKGLLS
jgi:hypothetical protein